MNKPLYEYSTPTGELAVWIEQTGHNHYTLHIHHPCPELCRTATYYNLDVANRHAQQKFAHYVTRLPAPVESDIPPFSQSVGNPMPDAAYTRAVAAAEAYTERTGEGAFVYWDIHRGLPAWAWIDEHNYYRGSGQGIPEQHVYYSTREGAYQ